MKTAMQELKKKCIQMGIFKLPSDLVLFDEYIKKEKQQIIDAYKSGMDNVDGEPRWVHDKNGAEKYFNETYSK